ncbi:hypothetical protein HPB50_009859 [Hyalomma asiaticum]|uniref:Uncharacterized protein n=1 Tax=Hyalomma asiaticum TaxID=266040 RepID=A0ACB7RWJ5_HYAAI|nr:hypothetical protein HPB50_009859 [Hyalomma asiaticum]
MTTLGAIGAGLLSVVARRKVLSAPQSCRVFQANLTRRWRRGTVAQVSDQQLADHKRRGPADGRCEKVSPSPQSNGGRWSGVPDAPWKAQRWVRRNLPVDRVPWPFRGCTVTEVDAAAQGAQLPAPPEAVLCAECRGTVFHDSHYKGHRHAPRAGPAAGDGGRASEATTLGDTELAAFCPRRLQDNHRFAALLTPSAEPSPAPTATEAGAWDTETPSVPTTLRGPVEGRFRGGESGDRGILPHLDVQGSTPLWGEVVERDADSLIPSSSARPSPVPGISSKEWSLLCISISPEHSIKPTTREPQPQSRQARPDPSPETHQAFIQNKIIFRHTHYSSSTSNNLK